MRNFSVGKEVLTKGDINVGIAPGKFDTKQLILSAIAVLAAEANGGMVRFVRTVNMEQLSKCVLFINDDFTTMDFVVEILRQVFFKSEAEANALMLSIHKSGYAVVGIYPYDIAVSKVEKTNLLAREHGFPLKVTIEQE